MVRILITGRVWADDEHRPRGAVADYANSRPDIDRLGEPVAAGGNQDDSLTGGLLNLVDSPLQRFGIIGGAVAVRGKVYGFGIVQPDGVVE